MSDWKPPDKDRPEWTPPATDGWTPPASDRNAQPTFSQGRPFGVSMMGPSNQAYKEEDNAVGGWYAGGARQAASGVKQLSRNLPNRTGQGWDSGAFAKGASDTFRGGMTLATPFMLPAMAAHPMRTAIGLGVGIPVQQGTEAGLDGLGVSEGWAQAGGDVAGVLTGVGMSRLPAPPPAGEIYGGLKGARKAALTTRSGVKGVIGHGVGTALGTVVGHPHQGGALGALLATSPEIIRGYRSGAAEVRSPKPAKPAKIKAPTKAEREATARSLDRYANPPEPADPYASRQPNVEPPAPPVGPRITPPPGPVEYGGPPITYPPAPEVVIPTPRHALDSYNNPPLASPRGPALPQPPPAPVSPTQRGVNQSGPMEYGGPAPAPVPPAKVKAPTKAQIEAEQRAAGIGESPSTRDPYGLRPVAPASTPRPGFDEHGNVITPGMPRPPVGPMEYEAPPVKAKVSTKAGKPAGEPGTAAPDLPPMAPENAAAMQRVLAEKGITAGITPPPTAPPATTPSRSAVEVLADELKQGSRVDPSTLVEPGDLVPLDLDRAAVVAKETGQTSTGILLGWLHSIWQRAYETTGRATHKTLSEAMKAKYGVKSTLEMTDQQLLDEFRATQKLAIEKRRAAPGLPKPPE